MGISLEKMGALLKRSEAVGNEIAVQLCKVDDEVVFGRECEGTYTRVVMLKTFFKCEKGKFVGTVHTHLHPLKYLSPDDFGHLATMIKEGIKPYIECVVWREDGKAEVMCLESQATPEDFKKEMEEVKEDNRKIEIAKGLSRGSVRSVFPEFDALIRLSNKKLVRAWKITKGE